MDARTIVPPFPIATTESLTDLHIAEENGSGVPSPLVSNLDRDSCDSFESMDVSSRDMGQSNSPMFNSLCAFFRTMNTSDEDGFPLGFYNDASPSTTPSGAVSSRITGNSDSDMADCEHDGFAYHSEEATMQADDSLESTEWASGESDSDALMAEIRINPSDSMSDAQYDGDSESSHDVFFIADASIGSLSVIAIEEEGEAQQDVNVDDEDNDDDEDEKFVEHEPTPWFGTNTPTPIPSFRQCLAPVFLRLLSTRVSVVGQSVVRPDSLWSPSSSSSSTSTPVPLASSVGLHSSLRFPVPGASLWSPSARLFSSPFPFPKLLQDDID